MATYKPYKGHWIVVLQNGETYCHCDNVRECKEEIETIEREVKNVSRRMELEPSMATYGISAYERAAVGKSQT